MPETKIMYFGQTAKINCDGNCSKAWGRNSRPRDSNDQMLADHELGTAPEDPGTYEGGHAKPLNSDSFANKWCVRECERCNMSRVGKHEEDLPVKSFETRQEI